MAGKAIKYHPEVEALEHEDTTAPETKRVLNYGWDADGLQKVRQAVDADGHLQVDILSGGGEGGAGTAAYSDSGGTDRKGLVDGDRHVQVDVLSMPAGGSGLTDTELRATPVPVSGTVTADLGATDNAVLDTIDAVLDEIKIDTEAIETAVEAIQAGQLADSHNVTVDNASIAVTGTFWQATQPVSGTVAVTQSGTWDEIGINDSGNSITVDGTVTANLSATDNAVLDTIDSVLDTINAKLVTGTDIGDVTINNSTGASAVNIQDGGNTITVDGTVAVTGVATAANQTTVIGHLDGVEALLTTIDADTSNLSVVGGGTEATALRVTIASNSTGVLSVDDNGSTLSIDDGGGTLTVDGTVTANLAAGTNNIGDVDVLSVPRSQSGPGQPGTAVDSYTHAAINLGAGTNQVLVSSAASKQIWVYGIHFVVNAAGSVSFQDEDDTAISGIMPFAANSGMAVPPSGNFSMPIWKLATDKDLEVDIVTSEVDGWIDYAIVSV